MSKERAIPDGFLTAGQLAKKMSTTVRTVQYYDRIGLLKPAKSSEGGRRLYSCEEVMRLHQIQTLQHLGFSLEDIRERLARLETPAEVDAALAEQERLVGDRIAELKEIERQIGALRREARAMETVDFRRYADIVINMQMRNPFFWMLKYMDEETMSVLRGRFDVPGAERFISEMTRLVTRAESLVSSGASPAAPESLRFAEEYWSLVSDFAEGEPGIIADLQGTLDAMRGAEENRSFARTFAFIEEAMAAMFEEKKEEEHE